MSGAASNNALRINLRVVASSRLDGHLLPEPEFASVIHTGETVFMAPQVALDTDGGHVVFPVD